MEALPSLASLPIKAEVVNRVHFTDIKHLDLNPQIEWSPLMGENLGCLNVEDPTVRDSLEEDLKDHSQKYTIAMNDMIPAETEIYKKGNSSWNLAMHPNVQRLLEL
ncbi:hypothetical protein Tco_0461815 [Tanacetum coccineum]